MAVNHRLLWLTFLLCYVTFTLVGTTSVPNTNGSNSNQYGVLDSTSPYIPVPPPYVIHPQPYHLLSFFLQLLTLIAYSSSSPSDHIIVITLDGTIHSLHVIDGQEKWSFTSGIPLAYSNEPQLIPSIYGNVYHYDKDKLKKLPLSIPNIVFDAPFVTSDGLLYIGSSEMKHYSIDARTGEVCSMANSLDNDRKLDASRFTFLQTRFQVKAIDPTSYMSLWSASYCRYTELSKSEFNPEFISRDGEWIPHKLFAHLDGTLELVNMQTNESLWSTKFNTHVIHFMGGSMYKVDHIQITDLEFVSIIEKRMEMPVSPDQYVALIIENNSGLIALEAEPLTSNYHSNTYPYLPEIFGPMNGAIPRPYFNPVPIFSQPSKFYPMIQDFGVNLKLLENIHVDLVQKDYNFLLGTHCIDNPVIHPFSNWNMSWHHSLLERAESMASHHDHNKFTNSSLIVFNPLSNQYFGQNNLYNSSSDNLLIQNWLGTMESCTINQYSHFISLLLVILFLYLLFLLVFIGKHVIDLIYIKNQDARDILLWHQIDTNSSALLTPSSDRCELNSPNSDDIFRIGRLNIYTKSILGYGKCGTIVYEGLLNNRKVAVKRMLKSFYSIAEKETLLLIESDEHPNVIRYYAMEEDVEFVYLALSHAGQSLASFVETDEIWKTMTQEQLRMILSQLTYGLVHLHNINIVHGDIKPQNVLISNNLLVKISDMGLAKKLESSHNSFSASLMGTIGWQAPELIRLKYGQPNMGPTLEKSGQDNVSRGEESSECTSTCPSSLKQEYSTESVRVTNKIDIFSMGCLFYYILTSKHPFGDVVARQMNICTNNNALLSQDQALSLAPDLYDLIHKMLSHQPQLRPTAMQVSEHVYFWDLSKRLRFLIDASDIFEFEKGNSPIILQLEYESARYSIIPNSNWIMLLSDSMIEELNRFRRYHPSKIRDFLRFIRNKSNHYRDLSQEAKDSFGSFPDGFFSYFCTERCPKLLIFIWEFARQRCLGLFPGLELYFSEGERGGVSPSDSGNTLLDLQLPEEWLQTQSKGPNPIDSNYIKGNSTRLRSNKPLNGPFYNKREEPSKSFYALPSQRQETNHFSISRKLVPIASERSLSNESELAYPPGLNIDIHAEQKRTGGAVNSHMPTSLTNAYDTKPFYKQAEYSSSPVHRKSPVFNWNWRNSNSHQTNINNDASNFHWRKSECHHKQ